jgi:hypothetical protein
MNNLAKLAAAGNQRHVTGTAAQTGLRAYAIEILADGTDFDVLTETAILDSTTTQNRLTITGGLNAIEVPKGHIVYPSTGYYFTAFTLGDAADAVAYYNAD